MRFLQQREINRNPVPIIYGTNIDAECYYCNVPGHLSNNCTGVPVEVSINRGAGGRGSGGKTGTGTCHIRFVLAQHDDYIIPYTWLLLDTCYTSSVGKNPDMFKNIREFLEEERINVVTNSGRKSFNEIGKYELFPVEAHFNLKSMSNIVALKDTANVPGVQT